MLYHIDACGIPKQTSVYAMELEPFRDIQEVRASRIVAGVLESLAERGSLLQRSDVME